MTIRSLLSAFLFLVVATLASLAPAQAQPKLLVYGDSLTAGYGLQPEQAFPAQLQSWLKSQGMTAQVVNGGVSGDTTAGGLARLDWSLAEKPTHALLALGANDMLRGLDPAQAERNLDAMIARMKAAGIKVMLVGMRAAPNLGPDYVRAFEGMYPRLAKKHDIPLYPFMLDGVAANPALNLPDGMHPNARGAGVMAERIGPHVRRWLTATKS